MESTLRWRSWLGASVIFFLIFGVIDVAVGIAVPAQLHLVGSFPGVVFGNGDAQLLGPSFVGLRHANPKLDTLLVDSMTSMCAMMTGWGIMILATAWFGLRRGGPWAFWALSLSGLVALVYYLLLNAAWVRKSAS